MQALGFYLSHRDLYPEETSSMDWVSFESGHDGDDGVVQGYQAHHLDPSPKVEHHRHL